MMSKLYLELKSKFVSSSVANSSLGGQVILTVNDIS